MKLTIFFLSILMTVSCHGTEYKSLRLGYDRIPYGDMHRWFVPVNRLAYTGFPIEKAPKKVKSGYLGTSLEQLGKTNCMMIIGGCQGKQRNGIIQYVKNGGGIVVYGKAGKELKQILPVKLLHDYPLVVKDIKDTGFKLLIADTKSSLTKLWRQNSNGLPIPHRGSIFKVSPKKKSQVLAYFIDQKGNKYPALIVGSFGKGRVVYFAGTLDRTQVIPLDNPWVQKYYPLNSAWNMHPSWDAVQLVWIAYASQRPDIMKLVLDYQRYLRLRATVFDKATALMQSNNFLRVENQKLADKELSVAKKALWNTYKADKSADSMDMTIAINIVKAAMDSLPVSVRKVSRGPVTKGPNGKGFWLAGCMADAEFLIGAFNDPFLKAYYRKYKKDLDFDGDAINSGYLFRSYFNSSSARKASRKQKLSMNDFYFKESLNLSGLKANKMHTVITIMQPHQVKLGKSPNCFAPEYNYLTTPGYQALGKYCEETPLITAVEYLNEPTVHARDDEFRQWLKNKYGDIGKLNSQFKLNYKSWQTVPSWKAVKSRIIQERNSSQGMLLTSAAGINWQICPQKGIKNIKELQNVKWRSITVPDKFERVLGSVDGIFWYRAEIPLAEGDKIYFQGVDDNADVYINGKHVKSNKGWDVPFTVYAPFSVINDNGKAVIHIKVNDERGNGGIYKNVFLIPKSNDRAIKISAPEGNNEARVIWALWHQFVGDYSVSGCKRFISELRKTTSKPLVDRSRGASFSAYVPIAKTSAICDVFGPHMTSPMTFDYVEGLTRAKKNIISEYYFTGYGERDPETGVTPKVGRFTGAFYRKHPRAEFRAAGRARNLFWETVARGFDGIECFAPTTFRWNWAFMSIFEKSMRGLYWSFYSTRFEARIPIKITAAEAWGYKNIYPLIKGSKPEHKIFILVSEASIGQSQLGGVNDLHPLKINARALYKFLVTNLKQQTGFVDVDRFVEKFTHGSQSGKTLFIVKGQYLESKAIGAINKFMNNGGVVIGFGPVGIYDPYGRWMNESSSKITGAKELFRTAQAKIILNGKEYKYPNSVYLFKPVARSKNIISAIAGDKYSFAYKVSRGKGTYYQFGIDPEQIKSGKGYDNVDEALIKKKWLTPDVRLQHYLSSLLKSILKEQKSIQKYYSKDKYCKLFLRKKGRYELLFIFNMDLLNSRTLDVIFPTSKNIEILYDKGVLEAGKSKQWSGSLAPGGCRILRLK